MIAIQALEKNGDQTSNPWKHYPTYKPSGIEWLGDVPEHWEAKRLKYSASINDDALPETTDPDFEFDYVDIGSVSALDGITIRERMIFDTAPSRARRRVKAGDTIVSTVRTYLRAIAPITESAKTMIVSTGFAVVRPRKVEPEYLTYALRESSFVENVVARSKGVSYPGVNASEVGCIAIPLPERLEQLAIADFLDRETGRIDLLVAKKRELIERLKEKRVALITHAVTRGLNPKAKLKTSGVEWLGNVPEHWGVKRLKFAARTIMGQSPGSELYTQDPSERPFLQGNAEFGVRYPIAKWFCDYAPKNVPARSLLLSVRAPVGALNEADQSYGIGRGLCAVIDNGTGMNKDFGWYAIQICRTELNTKATGSTYEAVSTNDVGNILLVLPSASEQRAIADFLDRETGKIDRLTAKVVTAVERLQEYRTALITAAVTGKIDVRK